MSSQTSELPTKSHDCKRKVITTVLLKALFLLQWFFQITYQNLSNLNSASKAQILNYSIRDKNSQGMLQQFHTTFIMFLLKFIWHLFSVICHYCPINLGFSFSGQSCQIEITTHHPWQNCHKGCMCPKPWFKTTGALSAILSCKPKALHFQRAPRGGDCQALHNKHKCLKMYTNKPKF